MNNTIVFNKEVEENCEWKNGSVGTILCLQDHTFYQFIYIHEDPQHMQRLMLSPSWGPMSRSLQSSLTERLLLRQAGQRKKKRWFPNKTAPPASASAYEAHPTKLWPCQATTKSFRLVHAPGVFFTQLSSVFAGGLGRIGVPPAPRSCWG